MQYKCVMLYQNLKILPEGFYAFSEMYNHRGLALDTGAGDDIPPGCGKVSPDKSILFMIGNGQFP